MMAELSFVLISKSPASLSDKFFVFVAGNCIHILRHTIAADLLTFWYVTAVMSAKWYLSCLLLLFFVAHCFF